MGELDEESHYSSRKRDREDQRELKRLVAIQATKEACRKVREARHRKDATLNIRWKDYMDKRKDVKKLLRREKELRRKTLKKIRERGELVVNYSGLTWVREKGREGTYQD